MFEYVKDNYNVDVQLGMDINFNDVIEVWLPTIKVIKYRSGL